MPRIFLEIAIDTVHDGLQALQAGADRLEVCSRLDEGGVTPDIETLRALRAETDKPLFAMVRIRAGSFLYTADEQLTMEGQVGVLKEAGADGIVFGALTEHSVIDRTFCERVVAAAGPLAVTFHRAFDQVGDLPGAAAMLAECGVSRILTSGGASNAWDGRTTLRSLVITLGAAITILPGGGVRPSNVAHLVRATGAHEVHSAARDPLGRFDAEIVGGLRTEVDALTGVT